MHKHPAEPHQTCDVLQKIEKCLFPSNADDHATSDNLPSGKSHPHNTSTTLYRTRKARILRSVRVFATALLVQCRTDSFTTNMAFLDPEQQHFFAKDLEAIAREWQLDISALDLKTLMSHLTGSATTVHITRDSWDAALEPERALILTLMHTLSVVASASWWVWDAYPSHDTDTSKTARDREPVARNNLTGGSQGYQRRVAIVPVG